MGNCCVIHGHDPKWVCAGEYWGSPMSKRFVMRGSDDDDDYSDDEKPKKMMRRKKKKDYYEAKEKKKTAAEQRVRALLVVDDEKNVMMNSSSSTEVKIRITKRQLPQLEELLENVVEVKSLSVHQILEELMNVNTSCTGITTTHDGSTMQTSLNTIPEMIEEN